MERVMGVKNSQCEAAYTVASRQLEAAREREARRLQNETGRLQQEYRVMKIDRKMNEIEAKKRVDPGADTALEENNLEQAVKYLKSDAEHPCYLHRRQRFPIRVTAATGDDCVTASVARARKVLQDLELERQVSRIQRRRAAGQERRRGGGHDILVLDSDSGGEGDSGVEPREPSPVTPAGQKGRDAPAALVGQVTKGTVTRPGPKVSNGTSASARQEVMNGTAARTRPEVMNGTAARTRPEVMNGTAARTRPEVTNGTPARQRQEVRCARQGTDTSRRPAQAPRPCSNLKSKSWVYGAKYKSDTGMGFDKVVSSNSFKVDFRDAGRTARRHKPDAKAAERQKHKAARADDDVTETNAVTEDNVDDDLELGADYRTSMVTIATCPDPLPASDPADDPVRQIPGNEPAAPGARTRRGWVTSEGYATTSSSDVEVSQTREILIIKERLRKRVLQRKALGVEDSGDESSADEQPPPYQDLSDYKILLATDRYQQMSYNEEQVRTARVEPQTGKKAPPHNPAENTGADDSRLPNLARTDHQAPTETPGKQGDGNRTSRGNPRDHRPNATSRGQTHQRAPDAGDIHGRTSREGDREEDTRTPRPAVDFAARGRAITSVALQQQGGAHEGRPVSQVRSKSVGVKGKRSRHRRQQTMTQDDLLRERSLIEDKMSRFFSSLEAERRREGEARRRAREEGNKLAGEEDRGTGGAAKPPTPGTRRKSTTVNAAAPQQKPPSPGNGHPGGDALPGVAGQRSGLERRSSSLLSSASLPRLPVLQQRGVPHHSANRSKRHGATFKLQRIIAEMLSQSSTSQLIAVEEQRNVADDGKPAMQGIQEEVVQ